MNETTVEETCCAPAEPSKFQRFIKDPVTIGLLAILISLLLIDANQLGPTLLFTADALWGMAPFFLLAIGFAAWAKATSADALIAKAFSGSPIKATVIAAMVGGISPFCSCGVIPLIAAMLGAGVPLAPVMAFWLASPIMDPEMFILTAAGISFEFAVAKTFVAIFMGLLGGFTILLLQRNGFVLNPLKAEVSPTCDTGCASSCDSNKVERPEWKFWQHSERMQSFRQEFSSVGVFLGKWLTLAFVIESIMVAYVSSEWIAAWVGDSNPFAIPLAAVVGVPSYLNGYAAIPLVSGLMDIGMSSGAAMAFVTAGAVSSIPAAIAVFAMVKKPVFALYLGIGLTGSMISAVAYQSATVWMN